MRMSCNRVDTRLGIMLKGIRISIPDFAGYVDVMYANGHFCRAFVASLCLTRPRLLNSPVMLVVAGSGFERCPVARFCEARTPLEKTPLASSGFLPGVEPLHVSFLDFSSCTPRKGAMRANSCPCAVVDSARLWSFLTSFCCASSESLHFLGYTFPEPIYQLIASSVILSRKEICHTHVVAVVFGRPVDADVRLLPFKQLLGCSPRESTFVAPAKERVHVLLQPIRCPCV